MPRAVLLTLCLTLCLAAPAAAQSTAVVTPDLAGAASRMRLTLDGADPAVGGKVPRGLTLAAQRGFRFDGKSVKGRCGLEQAKTEGCPLKTRVGTGSADVTASSALFGNIDVRATIESFLAPRKSKRELAGVIITLNVLGTQTVARGYVDAPAKGAYGLRVVFPELPPTPGGFSVTLKHFEIEFGAKRTVRRGHRRIRHSLLRNPRRCTQGSWLGRATLRFDSPYALGVIDAPIGCRERA